MPVPATGGLGVRSPRPLLIAAVLLPALPHALYAQAQGPTVLFAQDFEGFEEGDAPPQAVRDNTWTGDRATYRIVQTNAMGGKALEVGVTTFAQMVFGGQVAVEPGSTYRLTGTVACLGQKSYTVILRQGPHPYEAYAMINGTATETWERFDYVVKAGRGGEDAGVVLLVYGQGPFWLGDLKVEEYGGEPPVQDPPLRGNMVQNASFELGWDGWLNRDESAWSRNHEPGRAGLHDGIACTGRRSVRLTGDSTISSPHHPLAYGQTYSVGASVRADYPGAEVHLTICGPHWAMRTFDVPEGQWARIEHSQQIATPQGSASATPFAGVWVQTATPKGKHVWVDDVTLQFGPPAAFAPRAARELALTTDHQNNLVPGGEPFSLRLSGVEWPTEAGPPMPAAVRVERRDEADTVADVLEVPLAELPGSDTAGPRLYAGELSIPSLPTGYWRLVTVTGADPAVEGEAIVACVPRLPASTPRSWQAGVHPGLDPSRTPPLYLSLPACGLRWARLHDVCIATKWHFLEPERGEWRWAEADAQVDKYLAAGYHVLGLLDGAPGWRLGQPDADGSAMRYPDRDFADWENYVRETVAHFRGKVDHWEVMNEPVYAGKGPGGETNMEWYVELLKVAYRAAKVANREAVVVAGGGAASPTKGSGWWEGAFDAGLLSHCDAISYHGYGRATTQILGGPQPLVEFMAWARQQMLGRIGRELPVWDTEVGLSPRSSSRKFWLGNRGPDDPLEAARQAVVTLLCERAAGVEKTFYYAAFPFRLTEPCSLAMFSDINDQLTPLAVSVAIAEAQTEGLQCSRVAAPGPDTSLLEFRSPTDAPARRTVQVVWTLKGTQEVAVPVAPDARVTATSIWGRPLAVARAAGAVVLSAGPLPVYLEIEP